MAVPKKKLSHHRSGTRRGQINLTRPVTTVCSHCRTAIQPHIVCPHCGYYKGKKIV